MLKISRLPPSMARRSESSLGDVPRTGRKKRRKGKKSGNKEKTFEFRDTPSKNNNKRPSTTTSSATAQMSIRSIASSRGTTPIPSYPVNRPNLAATLRVQSARQKVRELAQPKSVVPKNRLTSISSNGGTGSTSKEAWGVRKSPAWRSMNYE